MSESEFDRGVRAERERVEAAIAWLENDLYNADCSAGHALGCLRKKLAQLPPRARSESGQSGGELNQLRSAYREPEDENDTHTLQLVREAWEEHQRYQSFPNYDEHRPNQTAQLVTRLRSILGVCSAVEPRPEPEKRESRTVLSLTLLGKQVARVVVDGGARLEPEDLWELAGSIRLYADDISGFRNPRPEPEPDNAEPSSYSPTAQQLASYRCKQPSKPGIYVVTRGWGGGFERLTALWEQWGEWYAGNVNITDQVTAWSEPTEPEET